MGRDRDLALLQFGGKFPTVPRFRFDLGANLGAGLENTLHRRALGLDVDAVALAVLKIAIPINHLIEVDQDGITQVAGHGFLQ